ncbi:hypothetical protein BHE74_00057804 [Ensete ventricosum]|nr:hypothetical protein BHE74_00057804 [Ensete ventricosum]
MIPLRFPNSSITAKVFMQKIGFKLHVLRLNRVESFYAFLLYFYSKCSEERRQPAMANPSAGVAGHGKAPAKGATGCGNCPRARPLAAQCLTERLAHKGLLPTARVTASRGSNVGRRGCRPLVGRLSEGKVCCRLRKGGGSSVVRVREEGYNILLRKG